MSIDPEIPIILIVFRRPRETADLMKALGRLRPTKLYVVADAPAKECDVAACREALEVATSPNWPCQVKVNRAEYNKGCRRRVSSGLDWVFSQEEWAIILEDDLLPSESFFAYASELLRKFRSDTRVMHISGNNHQDGIRRSDSSYTFSKHTHCWGWATWKRAWQHYDHDMKSWPAFRDSGYMERVCIDPLEREYFTGILNRVAAGSIDSWAYIWTFSCWKENGLGINPECNLVANQGFGETATHTKNPALAASQTLHELTMPLIHPEIIAINETSDRYTFYNHFEGNAIRAARSLPGKLRQWKNGLIRRLSRS